MTSELLPPGARPQRDVRRDSTRTAARRPQQAVAGPAAQQPAAARFAGPTVAPPTHAGDSAGGQRLPVEIAGRFAPLLPFDPTWVTVAHPGLAAHDHAADAVTVGIHVSFAAGMLDGTSPEGTQLLAHELIHVAQQLAPGGGAATEAAEAEAETLAPRLVAGLPVRPAYSVAYGTPQTAGEEQDAPQEAWPPQAGLAFSLYGIVIQPPQGLKWRTDVERELQILAMLLRNLMGGQYTQGLEADAVTYLRGTGGAQLQSAPTEEMGRTYVDLDVSVRLLNFLCQTLETTIAGLPDVTRIRPDQIELLRLGYRAHELYSDLTDAQVVAELGHDPLPPWYSEQLFLQVIDAHGAELRGYDRALSQLQAGTGGRAAVVEILRQTMTKLLEAAVVVEAVRTTGALAADPTYRALWNLAVLPPDATDPGQALAPPGGPINVVLGATLIGFIWTQHDLRDRITQGDTEPLSNGNPPTVELLQRYIRFAGRAVPDSVRKLTDQKLRDNPTDRNADPLPSTLRVAPPLEEPFYDTALQTEHTFVLDVSFSDVYDALANAFGGFAYFWEHIRVPDDDWARATETQETTKAGAGTAPSAWDVLSTRVGRSIDYAQADLQTVSEEERRMSLATSFAIDALGPPGGVETLVALNAAIRTIGTVIGTVFDLATMPRNEQKFVFPEEGLYIVRGYVEPRLEDDSEYRRGTSVAWLPVFARSRRSMGRMRLETQLGVEDAAAQELVAVSLALQEQDLGDEERRDLIAQRDALTVEVYGSVQQTLDTQRSNLVSRRTELEGMDATKLRAVGMTAAQCDAQVKAFNEAIADVDLRLKVRSDRNTGGRFDKSERLRAVFVTDTGQVIRPLIEVAEGTSAPGAHTVYLSDVTSPVSGMATGIGTTRAAAILNGLESMLEAWSGYGRGDLSVFIPEAAGATQGQVHQLRVEASLGALAMESVERITMIASLAAMVAAPFTGGASLALLVPIGIVGAIPAGYRLADRYSMSTLRLDVAAVGDMVDVVSSLAGVGQVATGAKFVRTAKFLAFVGQGGDAYGVVAVSYQMVEAAKPQPGESEGQRRARIAMAFAQSFQTIGMMGLGSAVSRRYGGGAEGRPHPADADPATRARGDADPATRARIERDADAPPVPRLVRDFDTEVALPPDLKGRIRVEIDHGLPPGDTVAVHYDVDALGLITDVVIRRAPGSTFPIVDAHFPTARKMLRYQGVAGLLRRVYLEFRNFFTEHGEPLPGTRAYEAHLEVAKLPEVIRRKLDQLGGTDDATVLRDVESLRQQLAEHEAFLDGLRADPAAYTAAQLARRGFVAGESAGANVRRRLGGMIGRGLRGPLSAERYKSLGLPDPHAGDAYVVHGTPPRLAYRRNGVYSDVIADAVLDGYPLPDADHHYQPEADGGYRLQLNKGRLEAGVVPLEVYTTASGVRATRPRMSAVERAVVELHGEEAWETTPAGYHWRLDGATPRLVREDRTLPVKQYAEGEYRDVGSNIVENPPQPLATFDIPPAQRAQYQAIIDARETARTARRTAAARVEALADRLKLTDEERQELPDNIGELERKHAGDPLKLADLGLLRAESKALSKAYADITTHAEALGEHAAAAYVDATFAGAVPLHVPSRGKGTASKSGELDQIWIVPGPPDRVIIIEAKGAGGGLGTRVIGAERHRQGTTPYLRDVAGAMAAKPGLDPKVQALLLDIADGTVVPRYLLVEAGVGTAGGVPTAKPVKVSEFPVTKE